MSIIFSFLIFWSVALYLFVSDMCSCVAPSDDRDSSQLEVKMWEPNKMSDYKVEQFLVVARSVVAAI